MGAALSLGGPVAAQDAALTAADAPERKAAILAMGLAEPQRFAPRNAVAADAAFRGPAQQVSPVPEAGRAPGEDVPAAEVRALLENAAVAPLAAESRPSEPALAARARQFALGMAYLLKPGRIGDLPFLVAHLAAETAQRRDGPPEAARIRARPAGFAGIAWDVSTPTVLEAARRGFYPNSHVGPMKWWSPPQRAVMRLDAVHIAKRFRRTMRASDAVLTFDRDFERVLDGCAAPRSGKVPLTWITPRAKELYMRLHREGHAHSVEVRTADGALAGGLFGLTVGPVFSALSMFHTADNASKFAIVGLYHHLAEWGFSAVDHQRMSPWVEALGGSMLARPDYEALLKAPAPARAAPGPWTARFSLADTAGWKPAGADEASTEG